MKIDGMFIEYLISGGVALIWIYPLTSIIGVNSEVFSFEPSVILLAIPLTFTIGMLIDFIALKVLSKQRKKIRHKVYGDMDTKEMTFYNTLYELSKINNSLVKHLEMRDTRVRASRGTFINFLLGLLLIPVSYTHLTLPTILRV